MFTESLPFHPFWYTLLYAVYKFYWYWTWSFLSLLAHLSCPTSGKLTCCDCPSSLSNALSWFQKLTTYVPKTTLQSFHYRFPLQPEIIVLLVCILCSNSSLVCIVIVSLDAHSWFRHSSTRHLPHYCRPFPTVGNDKAFKEFLRDESWLMRQLRTRSRMDCEGTYPGYSFQLFQLKHLNYARRSLFLTATAVQPCEARPRIRKESVH